MILIDLSSSFVSVIPAVVALSMAIFTRKVLLSLGVGIVLGALLLTDYSLMKSAVYIKDQVVAIVIDDGSINSWNMSIVAFLILLGMMTAVLTLSGGTRAFADWAQSKVKGKVGSQLLAAFLGVFIFVDDYFNSLAVGSIARPVTDRFDVSRSKLAYILDSTAAPMCVIMPASSWGAYIMTIVGGILVSHGITEYSPLGAYVRLIPMNFYAIFALLMVFAVIIFKLDIGVMRKHENDMSHQDSDNSASDLMDELDIQESSTGRVSDLILPIIILIIATVCSMLYTGNESLSSEGKPFSVLGAFENTDVGTSLIYGGIAGVISALVAVFRQGISITRASSALWLGARSMFGAILILVFAWTIGAVIKDIKTGAYLASLVQSSHINVHWLPVLLFILSGLMAFATGTSWGTFGIMLPIAGDIAGSTDIALMLPMLGAVLAGSVFGDHCSPISDTTILSSTGARCHHIDHVSTQLPYAIAVALVSAVGYIVLGLTDSILVSFSAASVAFVVVCFAMSKLAKSKELSMEIA
ncbi:Na+/H+ antiporter NhaC family protein [Vibrio sp.]|nr:Na+/H+ antiporter NhaC family protein [Vibrio sp.]